MLAAAELGSLAAAVAPSNESRMLSRLAGCLWQGWQWRRMEAGLARKVKVWRECQEGRGTCLWTPCARPCCQRVIFSLEKIIATEMSLSTLTGHGGNKTSQTMSPGAGG